MDKNDVNLEGQRVRFSKKIKRKVLLELAKGKKPQEVFSQYVFSSLDKITSDKKYISKLIHKWRKEMYENKEILYLVRHNVDNNMLDEEIENIGEDDEADIVLDGVYEELKENFLKIIN